MTNLGLAASVDALSDHWLALTVAEWGQGEDLNGDGDMNDGVLHVRDLEAGATTNLELPASDVALSGKWLAFSVSEPCQGEDLNGDGDLEDRVLHVRDLEAGATTNLKLAPKRDLSLSGDWLVFSMCERDHGVDLNDDGDLEDRVIHVHNLSTGETKNLKIDAIGQGRGFAVSGDRLVFGVTENSDCGGGVAHVHNLSTGETVNLGLRAAGCRCLFVEGGGVSISGDWLALRVWQSFVHVHNLSTGETTNLGVVLSDCRTLALSRNWLVLRNQFGLGHQRSLELHDLEAGETTNLLHAGSDLVALSGKWLAFEASGVLHLRDLEAGETTNLGLPVFGVALSDKWLAFTVREENQGEDLNGDGDMEDRVPHVADLSILSGRPGFLRGDCDQDGDACSGVNDALTLLSWLFRGDTRPSCIAACDTDGNGETELTDAVFGLDYCFTGTAPPPAPFPACGPGTEADQQLGCVAIAKECE